MTGRVLVVEDDPVIRANVLELLTEEGFEVVAARDGADGVALAKARDPDLVVCDISLPKLDGYGVLRAIREDPALASMPFIFLTAKAERSDMRMGMSLGADDYLTKPFNPRELVARVKSVLRRAGPERRRDEMKELNHGELSINAGKREVYVGDDEIQLAPKEFDLLWELLDHRGLVLTRDQLLERVWGYTFAGDTRTVDVHVRQLRRKLGDASPIVTVWGVGYKVSPAREPAKA